MASAQPGKFDKTNDHLTGAHRESAIITIITIKLLFGAQTAVIGQ